MQLVTVATTFSIKWPNLLSKFFEVSETSNGASDTLIDFDCLLRNSLSDGSNPLAYIVWCFMLIPICFLVGPNLYYRVKITIISHATGGHWEDLFLNGKQDVLGKVVIRLGTLETGESTEEWHPLHILRKKKAKMSIRRVAKMVLKAVGLSKSKDAQNSVVPADKLNLPEDAKARSLLDPDDDIGYKFETGRICVRCEKIGPDEVRVSVLQAENLEAAPAVGESGACDAFVVLETSTPIDDDAAPQQTAVIMNDFTPEWNENFTLKVKNMATCDLILTVKDSDCGLVLAEGEEPLVANRRQLLNFLTAVEVMDENTVDPQMLQGICGITGIEHWTPCEIAYIHPFKESNRADCATFDLLYDNGTRDLEVPFRFLRGDKGWPLPFLLDVGQKVETRARGGTPASVKAVFNGYVDYLTDMYHNRSVLSAVVLLFLCYPTVTKKVLEIVNYRTLFHGTFEDPVGRWFLENNFDVQALPMTGTYAGMLFVIGVPALFVVFGIPLLGFVALYYKRNELGNPDVKMKYGFLYDGYEPKYYFWETFQ